MEPQVAIHIQQHPRTTTNPRQLKQRSVIYSVRDDMIRRLLRDPVKVTAITAGVLVW